MLCHQFGQNLILCLDLPFQMGDSFLFGGVVRPPFLLKGSRAVLEESLLPAVVNARNCTAFAAQPVQTK